VLDPRSQERVPGKTSPEAWLAALLTLGVLTACEGPRSNTYDMTPKIDGQEQGQTATQDRVNGESFTEAVAEDICDLYMDCGYIATGTTVAACEANIYDEFVARWNSGDCHISQNQAGACLDYLSNLECSDLDNYKGEATPCSLICD